MGNWKIKEPEVNWQTVSKKKIDQSSCETCGGIPIGQRAVIVTQTSVMRGDDEVEVLCIPCAVKRGIRPGGSVLMLIWDKMPAEERNTFAGRVV
jgi:hypothetical protein